MSIAENICAIKDSLPGNVQLVAVSKKQPKERILEALGAGQRVYGENRVQEAYEHWNDLRDQYSDLALHLIGPLQTNKVPDALALFDVIQTIDRPKLVDVLATEIEKTGKNIECYIQVNTGEEDQKSGILPGGLKKLLQYCQEKKLNITGLMCIPPADEPPALHFALLKNLAEENHLKNLSMGMSGDYKKALALGATHIRLGTSVFGTREA